MAAMMPGQPGGPPPGGAPAGAPQAGAPGGAPGSPSPAPAAEQSPEAGMEAKGDQLVQGAATLLDMAARIYGPVSDKGGKLRGLLEHIGKTFNVTPSNAGMIQMLQHVQGMQAGKGGAPGGPPPGGAPGGQPPAPPPGM